MCEKCINPLSPNKIDYFEYSGPLIHIIDYDSHWFSQHLKAGGRKPHFVDGYLVGSYIQKD